MNHEQRITQLELQINKLTKIIESAGLIDEFIPLPRAARILGKTRAGNSLSITKRQNITTR